MSSAISKLSAAALSATQETTFALASINFDFSLQKVEPPQEFRELGACLSKKRREIAEDGFQHITARKLGALFHSVIPPVPILLAAYGTRVSEIAKMPNVNPKGSRSDGPFADLVGADGTSIWAAATSGSGAIAMHLLACMLARIWSPQEATAIWAELVEERKKVLEHEQDLTALAARHVSVARDQLANWDASARAWLKTADSAKAKHQTQLMLIVQTFDLTVNNKMSTYRSVIEAWSLAMISVERLISGVPQSVTDGSVLLGLSAWHIYPDMLALEKSDQFIKQKDKLVGQGGVLTIGLQSTSPQQDRGIYWSLPLACFRYYGDPVTAKKALGDHSSKVSMDQLMNLALGCIFREWNIPKDQYQKGASLLSAIWTCLQTHWPDMSRFTGCGHGSKLDSHSYHSDYDHWPSGAANTFHWLRYVAAAADKYLDSEKEEKLIIERMIAYGHRRCTKFLSEKHRIQTPFFGLANRSKFLALLRAPEEQIAYLREIAKIFGRDADSMMIRYLSEATGQKESRYGYATASTRENVSANEGDARQYGNEGKNIHSRFIYPSKEQPHPSEHVAILEPGTIHFVNKILVWGNAPALFPRNGYQLKDQKPLGWLVTSEGCEAAGESEYEVSDDFVLIHRILERSAVTFKFHFGDMETAALFTTVPLKQSLVDLERDLDVDDVVRAICANKFDPEALLKHLHDQFLIDSARAKSLKALAVAADIFNVLPGATISLEVASNPLYKAHWIERVRPQSLQDDCHLLSRQNTFSCVTFFETGGVMNIPPDNLSQVLAMSIDNSIYVAAPLLCDPLERPHPHEIRRIVGNIGKAGLAFLIPPTNPLSRKAKPNEWDLINHLTFDGKAEDSFQQTSLHLALTDYTIPFTMHHEGARDTEAYFQEALISVFDRTEWVADLDCIGSLESPLLTRLPQTACTHQKLPVFSSQQQLTCIDSWHELLDRPQQAAIVRSHENWIGRLATTCLSVQKQYPTVIIPSEFCWDCLIRRNSWENTTFKAIAADKIIVF
jgi:hypothetical protein